MRDPNEYKKMVFVTWGTLSADTDADWEAYKVQMLTQPLLQVPEMSGCPSCDRKRSGSLQQQELYRWAQDSNVTADMCPDLLFNIY